MRKKETDVIKLSFTIDPEKKNIFEALGLDSKVYEDISKEFLKRVKKTTTVKSQRAGRCLQPGVFTGMYCYILYICT